MLEIKIICVAVLLLTLTVATSLMMYQGKPERYTQRLIIAGDNVTITGCTFTADSEAAVVIRYVGKQKGTGQH